MRFIALRYKDTIAPTGTLAQGIGAAQINSHGEFYQKSYGNTTSERVFAVTSENLAGRAPCYLKTVGISDTQEKFLFDAYLNMSPAQTLKWLETNQTPRNFNVEICGTEPYIVGGHTAAGYWVDAFRQTILKNLYAAGDVAGGCSQKYVTGAFAEAEIVAEKIFETLEEIELPAQVDFDASEFDKFFAERTIQVQQMKNSSISAKTNRPFPANLNAIQETTRRQKSKLLTSNVGKNVVHARHSPIPTCSTS